MFPELCRNVSGTCFNGASWPTRIERATAFRGRATIREIADLAGVSIATVSRVLNGRPDVAPETREPSCRSSASTGYTREPQRARALAAAPARRRARAARLPAYFAAILAGAAEALYEQDMRVVLSPTQHEHDREVSLLDRLMHGGRPTARSSSCRRSRARSSSAARRGLPVRRRRPARAAARRHPLRLGGAHVGRRPGDASTCSRSGTAGSARSPARPAGSRPRSAGAATTPRSRRPASCSTRSSIVEADCGSPSGTRRAEQLLELPDPPTAIFAFNDNIAIGALRAARARGLRVPEDLSVVGFDDIEHAEIVTPTLTTVRQPLAEMGRTAVSLLVRLLEGQRFETLRVELATRLVVRESTGRRAR